MTLSLTEMKKNGKKSSFEDLFKRQIEYQKNVMSFEHGFSEESKPYLPQDNVSLFQYHMSAMLEELGEVLKSDKRWKTHRNSRYIPEEKLDELADVLITLMNLCIYSGFDSENILSEVDKKIDENIRRLNQECL